MAAVTSAAELGALRALAGVATGLVLRALFALVTNVLAGIHLAIAWFACWWASLAT